MSVAELRAAQRRGLLALAGRETLRVVSLWTQTILPPALSAVLFLAIFGGALGKRIETIEGLPYIDDLLTSPLRGWQVVLGYLTGSLARSFVAAGIVAVLAAPFAQEGYEPALAAGTLFLTGVVFGGLGIITGVWAETFDQHSFIANVVITPLVLVGGVFYSARALAEPWSTLTKLDPLYYLVDATRAGFTGYHEAPVWLSLTVAAAVGVAAFAAAAVLIARGWRLKP